MQTYWRCDFSRIRKNGYLFSRDWLMSCVDMYDFSRIKKDEYYLIKFNFYRIINKIVI